MKRIFLVCTACLTVLHAEILRVIAVGDLVSGVPAEVLDQQADGYSTGLGECLLFPTLGLPDPVEGYVGFPAGADGPDRAPAQRALQIALRLPDEQPVEGLLNLRDAGGKLLPFSFKFDPSKAGAATEAQFEEIRKEHYLRLAQSPLPGKAWFRHRAGELPAERSGPPPGDFDSTFRLVSGSRAVAENLALDRDLLLGSEIKGEAVEIGLLKGVTVRAIDWTGKLKPGEVKLDSLARLIPHDQHALFSPSMGNFLDLLDVIEKQGTPLLQSLDARNPYRHLTSRYQAQMGLDVPRIAATSMSVNSVAVTGGDPFFPSGTDVAVILATKTPDVLMDTLATMIGLKAKLRGAKESDGEGYKGFQAGDRSFSAYLAKFEGAVVVANSPLQLKRISEVVNGKVPSLGSLDEYKFFRQRYPADAGESAYVFLSDATIRRWSGPQMRISASRRTRAAAALGELAAFRLDGGKEAPDFSGLLGKTSPAGESVRSETYNTLGFLTPVSELDIKSATPAEAAAYERWRSGYEGGWAKVFDPIAVRLRMKEGSRELDISVMPLTVDSSYRDWIEVTGTKRPERGAIAAHPEALAFLSFAVDPESKFFKQFGEWSSEMVPALKAQPLAWVGDSVSIYVDDSFFWKALQTGDAEQILQSNFLRLPLGIRIASRSSGRLAIFLAGLRAFIEQSAPDLLKWEQRKHGDQTYLAVISASDDNPSMQGVVFYAALKDSLLLALDEKVLQGAIDRAGKIKHTGEHIHAEANPAFATGAFGTKLLERQRLESWAAIPVLNEWHRRAPGKDPALVHADHFMENIRCPGGQGYRWNEAARTMESVAFGYPAGPRGELVSPELISGFARMRAGINFEDDGLRLNATMDRGEAPPAPVAAAPEPEIPAGFPQPADLIQLKEGTVLTYEVKESMNGTPYKKQITTTSMTSREEGISIRFRVVNAMPGEEPQVHEDEYLLGKGYQWISSKDDERVKTFTRFMPILPEKLAPGLRFGGEHRSEVKTEEGTKQEMGDTRLKIVGLETVTVPAGVFENCVRIDGEYDYLAEETIGRVSDSSWFAPGVGLVKTAWNDDFNTGTEELEKIERP